MTKLERTLANQGIALPQAPTPVGAYRATIVSGDYIYVSGQFPFKNGTLEYKGKLGKDLTTEQGYAAAELCALNLLSQLKDNLKDKNIKQIVKVEGFINCCESFEEHAKVLDGTTNFLTRVLAEKAGHVRSVIGCNSLPYGAAIEITAIVELE